jgi:hypothetical protein
MLNRLHPPDYDHTPSNLYIYDLEDAPEHLVVIHGDTYRCTLYLYALHERGGDHNSERIRWDEDDCAADELRVKLSMITDRAQLEALDLESYNCALAQDGPVKYTACWHYNSHYAHPAHTLAMVLERAGLSTDQIKDSSTIHALISEVLTPREEPAPRKGFDGRAVVYLRRDANHIELLAKYDSCNHVTASLTLDEARVLHAQLGALIARQHYTHES